MVSINPAIENQVYCQNSNSATWYVSGNKVVTFASGDLNTGTSFDKQDISGGKKYTWDLGEHIIQNLNNYSYQIIDPYLEGCKRYNLWVNYRYRSKNFFAGCAFGNWITVRRQLVNGDFLQQSNQPGGFNPSATLSPGTSSSNCPGGITSRFLIKQFTTNQCTTFTETFQAFESGIHEVEVLSYEYKEAINQNIPPIKLKIIDGGVEYLYNINNRNSVQLVDIPSNDNKFIFSAGGQSVEITANKNSIASLICGLDCPPETCFKCRNGNQVCCYGSNGKVIDIIDDVNREIQTDC